MKVNPIIFVVLYLMLPFRLISQSTETCGTLGGIDPQELCNWSQSIDPIIIANSDIKVYNIFFWGIRDSNGNGNGGFDEHIRF
jgi:hypothetical protein